MEAWERAGARVKADWVAMIEAASARSAGKVKLPFVPVALSGRALAAALEDLLPAFLGANPNLLTVIERDGRAIKAYAEDASGGVYERLVRVEVPEGASVDDLVRAAAAAGVEIGVVKRADARFFEPFEEEPEDLAEALALLISGVASALRDGRMRLSPEPAAAALLRGLALERETIRLMLSGLLPEGSYGLALACSRGPAALVLEVKGGRWSAREVEVASGSSGAMSRELVDGHGCAVAAGLALPDARRLLAGETSGADFLRARGRSWAVATRSGLEALLGAAGPLVELLGLERELEECGVDLETVLSLLADYVDSAREYARARGVGVKVSDGPKSVALVWGPEGVREEEAPEPLKIDWSLVRGAVSALASEPLARLGRLVPRGVVDHASYETAVAIVECSRPRGRLLLFGGPHRFFDAAWEGDACVVFVDRRGGIRVLEFPARALGIEEDGRRLRLARGGADVDLLFRRVRVNLHAHGAGRYFGAEFPGGRLPGLDVERGLWRLVSGRAEIDGESLDPDHGWMLLERGAGRLLRWPFGATWHYASWLFPDGASGAGVRVAPMLGEATPRWLRRLLEDAVDGAVAVSPDADGPVDFAHAVETGDRVRLVRGSASAGGRELRYKVLSGVVAPFDEEGQVIFRLRCLCGDGAGLVEIPASLPGREGGAEECALSFTPETVSLCSGGRELLAIERDGSRFLGPYSGPVAGAIRRAARRLFGLGRRAAPKDEG